jgi:phytanoyl-CoA hydroxylase
MPGLNSKILPSDSPSIPQLYVNDGALKTDQVGLLPSTDPNATSMMEMRRLLNENGYLYLKGVLPREDVLEARKEYFEHLQSTGLLKPGTKPVEGVFNADRNPEDYPGIGTGNAGTATETSVKFQELALSAHKESWYQDVFCKHPALLAFVSEFTGWKDKTMSVERTLLRNNIPGNKAIGVHYDFTFLRHGEDSVLTVWVPMGDIKINGGGLIYLEKGQ